MEDLFHHKQIVRDDSADLFAGQDRLQEYEGFFTERLQDAMNWYYQYRTPDGRTILSAAGTLHHPLPQIEDYLPEEEDRKLFSAGVFFTCLIPQVVSRVAGKSAVAAYHKVSGWPVMLAGPGGGLIGPEQWLYESRMLPGQEETDDFNDVLDAGLSFHKKDLRAFFARETGPHHTLASERLRSLIAGKETLFFSELESATLQAAEHFRRGEFPVYYLTQKEREEK